MTSAIRVNPWDQQGVAKAINRGLLLSDADKAARHATLHKHVVSHTSHMWAASFVKLLLSHLGSEHTAHATPVLEHSLMIEKYTKAKQRLLLFDYDVSIRTLSQKPTVL